MLASKDLEADHSLLLELGQEAGRIAMQWFGKEPEVWMKEGQSPVSEADFAVDRFLQEELLKARPDYGWLSEETDDNKERLTSRRVFVVDPIDGTRGFIKGEQQWCVSIAVVEAGRPLVGILECPALQQTITAAAGEGAWSNGKKLGVRKPENERPLRATGPRSFLSQADTVLPRKVEKMRFVPSLAYRIAMIATGFADLSLARANAKDWDLAAADLIAHESRACLTDMEGTMPIYNKPDVRHGALLACPVADHKDMLDLAREAMNNAQ